MLRDHMVWRADRVGLIAGHVLSSSIRLGVAAWIGFGIFDTGAAWAETVPEALAKAYQSNPQLNAERARQRATDENVPQALAGYRPQIGRASCRERVFSSV